MLPTLNLQFTPPESLDASLPSQALAPPDGGTTAVGGFADLLRLRVDTTLAGVTPGGQLLPQAGSELPVAPDRIAVELIEGVGRELADDALPIPAIDEQLLADPGALADGAGPQIELALPVRYPAVDDVVVADARTPTDVDPGVLPVAVAAPTAEFESAAAGSTPPSTMSADPGVGRAIPGPVASPLVTGQGPAQRLPTAAVNTATRTEMSALESGPQHRLAPVSPQAVVTEGVAVRDEQRPVIDVSRRPDTSLLQGAATGTEEVSDVFKARPAVVQTVQVLNAQANPQQPQPMFTTAPTLSSPTETTYTAAARQASDLIAVSVRDAGWGDQLGERVLLMAGNQVKTAEIRLSPAELGPLRVQVAMDDGAANVTFQAQHAVTREAIEQALPRLRELLAENGLSLGQANVGEQGVSERNRDQQPDTTVAAQSGDELPDGPDESGVSRHVTASSSLVDTFA